MWENPKAVLNKKADYAKLLEYGFIKQNEDYVFSKHIMDNMFKVTVFVSQNGTKLKVTDNVSKEEYIPVYVESAVGAFVVSVRTECEQLMEDIAQSCFYENIFKEINTKLVLKYIEEKYNTKAEFLWERTPKNAIFRKPGSKKWFAALLSIEYSKLGIDKGGEVEIINFKEMLENIEKLLEHEGYLPGYHMNKKYWYTVLLDGSVPIEEVYCCIDRSVELVGKNN